MAKLHEDPLRFWLGTRLVRAPKGFVTIVDLFEDWREFCVEHRLEKMIHEGIRTKQALSTALTARPEWNLKRHVMRQGRGILGLRFKAPPDTPEF